ncbi:hypothetical protein PC116_g18805 [Phytophthora cactorum]|nr:hypothetical protein Pcac1_g6259 [Phytophthora cactorum]KAG3153605.1 hypothetical protein PC128_g22547 [Phytophthora cactorum]KAG4232986.1 hypothetical protein PC116_g18805 [Phytophthora cactorum]
MIIVNLYVAGAQRPLRELLDSGATNNFFRASCLAMLPSTIAAREGRGKVDVKLSHAALRGAGSHCRTRLTGSAARTTSS